MNRILILGAGGFIGDHLTWYHKAQGDHVTAVDLKVNPFRKSPADSFILADLLDRDFCFDLLSKRYDMVYMFAAVMGGAGFIFTKDNDAEIMGKSLRMNINVLDACLREMPTVVFSSSACVYPEHNQLSTDSIRIEESSAYPAAPDSNYGWEKLTTERLMDAYRRNHGLDTRIVRIHNVFGPYSVYDNGKEKAPAAVCRKVITSNDHVEIWGNGQQHRSFLYIDDFLEGLSAFIKSNHAGPVNIGSTEIISINDLAKMAIDISGKALDIRNVPGPVGVNARVSDNTLITSLTGWHPKMSLKQGIEKLYKWMSDDIRQKGSTNE